MSNALLFLFRSGAPVPLIGFAAFATALLTPLLQTPSMLFIGAVALSAWYGGMGPGLLAIGVANITV